MTVPEDRIGADRPADSPSELTAARPAVAPGWDRPTDREKDPAEMPELAGTPVPDELRTEIEAAMARYPDRHSAALPALHAAQRRYGWCSPEAIRQVAAVMRVTPAYLSSLTTFYDMFNTEPVGTRYVYVCTSVACNLCNAQAVFEALRQAGEQLEDTHIREFECLGACDMAPMASVDGRYIGPLDPSDAPEIVAAIREGRLPLPGRGLEAVDERAPEAVGSRQEAVGSEEGSGGEHGRAQEGSDDG